MRLRGHLGITRGQDRRGRPGRATAQTGQTGHHGRSGHGGRWRMRQPTRKTGCRYPQDGLPRFRNRPSIAE